MDVITYLCWDYNKTMLVKGAPCLSCRWTWFKSMIKSAIYAVVSLTGYILFSMMRDWIWTYLSLVFRTHWYSYSLILWQTSVFLSFIYNVTFHAFLKYWPLSKVHGDVIKWKHFPHNWPFVQGIHRSPVNSQHKGQRRGALMFSLICVRINDWVNNREAGDLRRYHAHYDVIVMDSFHSYDFYTLRPWQNRQHFPDGIFNCISLNENIWILFEISLKFVSKGPINDIPALIPIMAWRWPDGKPFIWTIDG